MKAYFLFFILGIFVLASCHQDASEEVIINNDTNLQTLVIGDDKDKSDIKDKGKESCFKLIYPLSIEMPDGSILSGEKEALWTKVKSWYEINSNSKVKPSIIYPLDLFWIKDKVSKTISNKDDLEKAKKYCDTDKGKANDCFAIVYPISWTMPDGIIITMTDEDDWEAFKSWYETNPDSKEKPNLIYPLDLIFDDGDNQTVNNEEEMILAKKDCN